MRRLSVALLACLLLLVGCGGSTHSTSQSATGSVHPVGWGATPKGITLPAPLLGGTVSTATMFDAVTVSNIPSGPFAVAGYTAGQFPTWGSLLRDFPSAHHVSIAINASLHADCLDVEPGDAVPSQAGPWVRADLAAGFHTPCVYSDLSEMPAVRASLGNAGLSRSQYLLWLAWYRGFPGLVAGYDAVQYTDACLGRNLDCNTVTLNFLRMAQPPYVPPPTLPLCFHKRESTSTCSAAKAQVASAQRAIASSQRAYVARDCPVLTQRIEWFSSHLKSQPKVRTAFRRGALATSRRAFTRQGCQVFRARVAGNQSAIQKIEAAN